MNEQEVGQAISELSKFLDSIPVGGRRARFEAIAQGMINAQRPIVIIETGCMRPNLTPEADGCSTLVWDYVARVTQGDCYTIDRNPVNADFARSKVSERTHVICGDSVRWLSSLDAMTRQIDLLYLDSMDWEGTQQERALSALHHASELSAAWQWIAPGGLIAVDDCHGEYAGKHAIVKRFFEAIGAEPLTNDYIHVWRKPSPTPVILVPSK